MAVGTLYKITLQWGPVPHLSWEALPEAEKPEWIKTCSHTYMIRGSFNGWLDQVMLGCPFG